MIGGMLEAEFLVLPLSFSMVLVQWVLASNLANQSP